MANNLSVFLSSIHILSKPQLKVLPYAILGMVQAESVVRADIVSKLKGDFELNKNESNLKRFWRFFNNPNFDIFSLYHSFITHIIKNYKFNRGDNNRVHITFAQERYAILSFSIRIGRQAFPLWFKCFKGYKNPDAYTEQLIIEGIDYIHNLFKDYDFDLIFLADRWFNSTNVMKHIDSLNHKFVIRVKTNIKVFVKEYISQNRWCMKWKFLEEITPKVYHCKIFREVFFSIKKPFKVNLVISPSKNTDDPFYLVTNADPKRAAKDYAYRWSIECMHKNEKSNGFYLEASNVRNIRAFNTILGLANIALIWMTILGIDYSKNKHRNNKFITDTKKCYGRTRRMISLFKLGLRYFNLAINSAIYRVIKCNFILYDS